MKELELKKETILLFLERLRFEDKKELDLYHKDKQKEAFLKVCFDKNNEVYFLGLDDNNPLSMGGLYRQENGFGQVWLLCAKDYYKRKIELYKYVLNKLNYFKKNYIVLYNYIYKTNFKMLKFLKRNGFRVLDLKDRNFKMFYFKKEE